MPDSTLTEAIKQAYVLAPSHIAILETLEISHPLTGSLYYVKGIEDITFTLEDASTHLFTAIGFDMSLPEKSGNGAPLLQITIDNIDRVISDFINVVKDSTTKITVKYRPYLSSNYTVPQMSPPLTLWMTSIVVNDTSVQAQCTFMDMVNKPFPSERYSNQIFPSLGQ